MSDAAETASPRKLWEEVVSFEESQTRLWQVARVRFWIRRSAGEWFIAFEEGEDSQLVVGREEEPPEWLSWHRYVAGTSGRLMVRPVLPDRPIVIRPSSPVKILPGKQSRYFIHLPVWIALSEAGGKQPLSLVEHPGQALSSTWFGNPDDGELCYSFTSDLYKDPQEREDHPLMAICPLSIKNGSTVTLDFQRVCVRAPYLHLYGGSRFLCTNELVLVYRGAEQSQIDLRDAAPAIETGLKHLTPPRTPVSRNLIKRSFEYFRALSFY